MFQNTQIEVDYNDIHLNADGFVNCRSVIGDITDLVCSIKAGGLNNPPVVWDTQDGKYILVDGYRRFAAIDAIRAEDANSFRTISVTPFTGTLEDALAKNLETNIHRQDLNPADQIDAVARLYEGLQDQNAVAQLLGKSQAWVSIFLKIKRCVIPDALTALRHEKVNLTFVKSLSKVTDDQGNPHVEVQKRLLERELGEEVKDPTPKPKTKRTAAEVADLKAQIYEVVNTTNNYDRVHLGGVIQTLDWLSCKLPTEALLDPDSTAADVESRMDDDSGSVD